MKKRKIGWIGRLLWRNYNPRTQYNIKSGFAIVACEDANWPVILTANSGEFHVLRLSRNTVMSMIDFISLTFPSNVKADSEADLNKAYRETVENLEFGDGVVVRLTKRGWRLKKQGVGMSSVALSESEWRLTGSVLKKILLDY